MNILTPSLRLTPAASVAFNSLYDEKDPRVLTQDLMSVDLSNQTYINVSWYPEHDTNGGYFVSVIRNRERIHEVETTSPFDALLKVESLAVLFSQSIGNVCCSSGQTTVIGPPNTFEILPAA